jgi:RecA-family ATPase
MEPGQDAATNTGAPGGPPLLEPDRDQLEIFINALFRYAGTQGFVSLRAFLEGENKKFRFSPTSLAGGLTFLIDVAEDDAGRAANYPKPVVFCPPIAVFSTKDTARERDIAHGLALSVELDEHPQLAREQLEQLLGPATIVVRSGGMWTDPSTGKACDRLHLHWRLAKPAQGPDLAKLKQARDWAARFVGGDPSNKPVCHPIRWPGSWHRKATPRLCEIETANPDAQIELNAALAALISVAPAQSTGNGQSDPGASGSDWADLVGAIIAGKNLHASLTPLAMKMLRAGMMDAATVRLMRGILEASGADHDERWRSRWDDIPRAVSTARAKLDQQQQQTNTDAETAVHWHGDVDPRESRRWLIEDLIPEVGKGLVAGQWGTYKTFTVLEIAYCVMTGTPFLGFEIERPGGVLFIALEGQSEVAIRLQGLIDHKGAGKPRRAPFAWVETCPPLLAANAVDELAKIVDQVARKLRADFDLPLVLVVIDTVVIAAGYTKDGADNDTATTNAVLLTMARLAVKAGCFVFGVDHFGKNADVGTRGASVKEGNADVILALLGEKAVTGQVSNCRLAVRKRRSGEQGMEFPFTPRPAEMGVNQRGKKQTTLVLDWGASTAPQGAKAKDDWGKGKGIKVLRRIIMSMLVDQGIDLKPWADGPTVRALKMERVKAEFLKGYYVDGDTEAARTHAKRTAFQRTIDSAADKDVITVREIGGEDFVWLTRRREAP